MSLGWIPLYEPVKLPREEGDFIFSRIVDAGVFPAGSVARMEWSSGQTWFGQIAGDTVIWNVEYADHSVIPSGATHRTYLEYPTSVSTTDVYVWFYGPVHRV
jgi:hypothetical protein